MKKLTGKTAIITGSSRGIGRAMALKFASEGANIVLAAKTTTPHPKLSGTILSVKEEVESLGAKALAVKTDVRFYGELENLAKQASDTFGSIDILVNNAGAIKLLGTEELNPKHFDLMHEVNVRATFMLSKVCLPYLREAGQGHILNLSPPINLNEKWLIPHVAYTISKYSMSFCTTAMAKEFEPFKIAVNSLWPQYLIYTAAVSWLMGENMKPFCRKPEVMADAAYEIVSKSSELSGNHFLDSEVLQKAGVKDFDKYAFDPSQDLASDLYVD